jgi:hypothetical protein
MAILNLARAHPGLLVALLRHLDRLGDAVDPATLYRRFVPGSIDLGADKAPALSFQDTLNFGRRIGALIDTPQSVTLEASQRGTWTNAGLDQSMDQVLDLLLNEENAGANPFEESHKARTADFARLATWFVRVDPTGPLVSYRPSAVSHPKRLLEEMGARGKDAETWVPGDRAGWDAFARWVVALGLARERPTTQSVDQNLALMPDLYRLVKRRLPALRGTAALESLLTELGTSTPLLTTGRLDKAWNERVGNEPGRHVFPALAFALFRLDREGAIQLKPAGDGIPYTLRFGVFKDVMSPYGRRSAEERRYSNVTVLEGKS